MLHELGLSIPVCIFHGCEKVANILTKHFEGKVLLTHLETLLKDTWLGNTPKQMKEQKEHSIRSRVEDIHSLSSCDKVLLSHYCFKELLCGHYQLSSLELLAMIWTESWKSQSNSLVVCEAWGQVGWWGGWGSLWMNAARRWLWHAEYSCRAFLRLQKKFSCFLLTRCTLWARSHTAPVWLLKVFLYACDLDQTFLWSCAHHFAVIWHMQDSHTHTHITLMGVPTCGLPHGKYGLEIMPVFQRLMETPAVIYLLHTSYQSPGAQNLCDMT